MLSYGATTALLVVDVQNDFADEAGSLFVAGADAVVARAGDEVRRATAAGATVIYTQDWHPASTPHFAKDGGVWPVHCVADTWGAAFHPDLLVVGPSIRKGSNGEDGYSGFTMCDPISRVDVPTELDGLLREHGITDVVICGLATDYCVRATALDAVQLGYGTTVITGAIAAVELVPGDGARAVDVMLAAGVRLESSDESVTG